MMHYKKGENVEQELRKENLPFKDCLPQGQNDFLWMQVRGGTKMNNVLDYVKNALDNGEYRSVVWSGYGGGVVKTVSCAEILKRCYDFYQLTRTCYTRSDEHWLPQMEGLEEIVVNRQLPCIHILLSLDPLEESINGVQKPKMKTDFWIHENSNTSGRKQTSRNNNPTHRRNNNRSNKSKEPQQHHENKKTKNNTNESLNKVD